MNTSKLNEWLTITANLGVIAGIVFLAIEVQQNTEIMQAQTQDSITEKQMDWYMNIGTSEFASDLYFKGREEGVLAFEVDSAEINAFNFIAHANPRIWENEWYQYKKQLFEDDEFLARSRIWPVLLSSPGFRAVWDSQKGIYAPDFREYLDAKLEGYLSGNSFESL